MEYADREQLWNAVEAVENQWNSQLARRFVLALPREVPEELYPQMVQDYCNQFFVSKFDITKPCKDWLKAEGNGLEETKPKEKWHYEKKKAVKFFLKPNREKTSRRMCLSEHPFGTIKRAMGATYFLLKMRKVAGEFVLFCLGYNLERAKNLLGFQKMMELMEQA